MSVNSKTAFHDRYIEGWNDHDPEMVMAQFAEGGTYVDPFFDEPIAGEEIGDFVRLTAERFPDVRFEQRRVLDVSSDDIRIEEWTMHGTHEGMREGLPPTETQSRLREQASLSCLRTESFRFRAITINSN